MNPETRTGGGVETTLHEEGSLARIVIDVPRGNVFTREVCDTLLGEVTQLEEKRDVRLITLEGAGKHFSFGASVEEHLPEEIEDTLRALHRLVLGLAASPIPIAALVRGRCLGGAFEVAAACHFIFTAPDARFALPEIKLGVFPPAGSALLPRRIGQSLTDRMVILGEEFDVRTLEGTDLVTQACHDDDLFEHAVLWHQHNFSALSASSLRFATVASRRRYLEELETDLAAHERFYLEQLVPTEDANEGISAFIEKRDPVWRNR